MKLIDKNINTLTMKYPASWHDSLCREGLLSGNGKIGANIYGGVKNETVIINHAGLWSGKPVQLLPDVSGSLAKTRQAMDAERFDEAHWILANSLKEKGYNNERGYPLPLAALNMTYTDLPGFSDYLRAVNMETGEVSSQFKENGAWVRKDLFVSRKDDIILLSVKAEAPILNAVISLDTVDDKKQSEVYEYVKRSSKREAIENILTYTSLNTDGNSFGAAVKAESADGDITHENNAIRISGASEILVKIKVFVNGSSDTDTLAEELRNENGSYEYYLERHLPLHKSLYESASLCLYENDNRSNEELLLEAYGGKSPNELIEKLWRYGRYLFISGSREDGLPFTMYGLWAFEYNQIWSHNMANENIQMIYWHTNGGNLRELGKPLMEYYISRMDAFRENAKKLYGCKGIFIPAGTTPNMPYPNQIVPVILNWVCAAGWLSQHYYRYYQYTGDVEYLKSAIVPFMKAAADFYEEFIVFDENGNVKIYPSVSPENSPINFITKGKKNTGHPMTTTVNSTIDLAIIKELFTNLIKVSAENNIFTDKTDDWNKIINSIPEYKTNGSGEVREWQDERFKDRYYHRHLSHIYPVFPGDEVTTEDSRISAFEKAVDLREIGAQTGWSLAHMASIYARFERGSDAMQCLNDIARTCMQPNLLTLHNDWRRMDISLEMESDAPIQLDALMGYVNAVQEMILYSSEKLIKLLPALPDNMTRGKIKDWRFVGGSIGMEWDIENSKLTAQLTADRDITLDIKLPKEFNNLKITGSDIKQNGIFISVDFKKDDILKISNGI